MRLKNYLHENQIKPSVFAEKLGVAPSTITRILKGERTPRIGLVAKITEATNNSVSLNDFLPDGISRPDVGGGAAGGDGNQAKEDV